MKTITILVTMMTKAMNKRLLIPFVLILVLSSGGCLEQKEGSSDERMSGNLDSPSIMPPDEDATTLNVEPQPGQKNDENMKDSDTDNALADNKDTSNTRVNKPVVENPSDTIPDDPLQEQTVEVEGIDTETDDIMVLEQELDGPSFDLDIDLDFI